VPDVSRPSEPLTVMELKLLRSWISRQCLITDVDQQKEEEYNNF